jgi:hypothetical protein
VKALSLENHRLDAQLDYQATKHAAELHTMHSLVLNSEVDERYATGIVDGKRKSLPSSSYPIQVPTSLPKIQSATLLGTLPQKNGSQTDSFDSLPESSIQISKAVGSTKKKKYVPTIEDLLNTHKGMPRSQSDAFPSKPDGNILSQSAPSLAIGSAVSIPSAAERKVAAIIELNIEELKKNKKSK